MNKKKKKKNIPLTINYGASSGSEEEAYFKAMAACRICSHIKIAHYRLGNCLDATITNEGVYHKCKCKEFIPSDNLEYLEFMSEKNNAAEKKRK